MARIPPIWTAVLILLNEDVTIKIYSGSQADCLWSRGVSLSPFPRLLPILHSQQDRGVQERVHVWPGERVIIWDWQYLIIIRPTIRWTLAAASTVLTPSSCRWWRATTRTSTRGGASAPGASSGTTTPGCVWTWARASQDRRWSSSSVTVHQDKSGPLTSMMRARRGGGPP